MTLSVAPKAESYEFKPKEESRQTYNKLMKELQENPVEPLYIDWEDGAVILKRGDKIKKITKFKNISTKKAYKSCKHHRGVYPWEGTMKDFKVPSESFNIYFQKDRLQYWTKYLGITPKRLVKIYQACMFKAFIPQDLKEIAQKYCRSSGKKRPFIKEYIQSLNDRQHIIRQCLQDGQENIIPFIISNNRTETPSEFRSTIGKSMWKKLLKQSKTRNYLICETMRKGLYTSLEDVIGIPTSVLKNPARGCSYDDTIIGLLKKDKSLTKPEYHGKICNTVTDTKRMYQQLGLPIPKQSSKWDIIKWEDKHSWCVEQINLKKYSPTPFPWMKGLTKESTSACGNYRAILLDNALAIRSEGDKLHHCVGMYSGRVRDGKYLVWHIEDISGDNQSTLGCYLTEGKVSFNQHYGHCNSRVTEDGVLAFREQLIKGLQKEIKKEKTYG